MKTRDVLLGAAITMVIPTLTATMQLPAAVGEIDDPDAYAVYASVLPVAFDSGDTNRTRAAIRETTQAHMYCLTDGRKIPAGWAEVVENFKKENASSKRLRSDFTLGVSYTLVSDAEITAAVTSDREQFAKANPGREFYEQQTYRRFPNQKLYSLSAVGFNAAKTRAFVSVQYSCGFDCAGGHYFWREKVNGSWVQPKDIGVFCSWVA